MLFSKCLKVIVPFLSVGDFANGSLQLLQNYGNRRLELFFNIANFVLKLVFNIPHD